MSPAAATSVLPKQRVEGSNPFSRSKATHPIYGPAAGRVLFLFGSWTICLLSRGFQPRLGRCDPVATFHGLVALKKAFAVIPHA